MKVINFVVSTILIVLISQHSTSALPFTTTSPCPEEYEIKDDKCVPIHNHQARSVYETSTPLLENLVRESESVTELNPTPKVGACREGTKRDKNGVCKKIKYPTTTESYVELTTEFNAESTPELNVESTTQLNVKLTAESTTEFDVLSTTEFDDQFTTGFDIQSTTENYDQATTENYDQATTEYDESVGGVDVVKGCPKGTEPDEEGACQAIGLSSTIKNIIDPTILLNGNGSCPDGYGMSNGRCLFIGSKGNGQSYRKDVVEDNQSNVEYVPTLSDNSCPEGTIYSEYGLCRKRVTSSSLNTNQKTKDSCPNGYQSIDGKCLPLTQYFDSTPKTAVAYESDGLSTRSSF